MRQGWADGPMAATPAPDQGWRGKRLPPADAAILAAT